MKNFRQSRGMKAVAVILLFFCLIFVPLCIIGEAYLYYDVFDSDRTAMLSKKSYAETSDFTDRYNQMFRQLAEYIHLKSVLETNGELDYDKIVIRGTGEDPKSSYTLGELLKHNSFFVEDVTTANDVTLEQLFAYSRQNYYVYEDAQGQVSTGYTMDNEFIRDFSGMEDGIVVNKLEDAEEYFREHYKEAAFQSYTVLMQNNMESDVPEGAVRVYTLEDAAYRYTYYVAFYLYYEKLFQDGASNFVYWIYNGTHEYSNASSILGTDPFTDFKVSTLGMLRYASSGYTVDTNMKYIDRSSVEKIEQLMNKDGQEVKMHIAVMADCGRNGIKDGFSNAMLMFETAQNYVITLMVLAVIGLVMAFIFILYLLLSAGHTAKKEGITLTWFDRWYTEIGIFLGLMSGFTAIIFTHESIVYGSVDGISDIIIIFIWILMDYFVLLFFGSSLLRRVKAGTMWRNSLVLNGGLALGRFFKKVYQIGRVVYQEREATTRVIVCYITVLAASVISGLLIVVCMWWETPLVLFFFLVFVGIQSGVLYALLRNSIEYKQIVEGAERMADGDLNYKMDVSNFHLDNKRIAIAANRIGDGLSEAVEKSLKDERMKTDLITNVSHDIKTPLTSIINYVDLLKREKIEDEKILSYIDVLDSKSQRLKNLTDDLVEASKLSSGNVELIIDKLNLVELVNQTNGEFTEKFAAKNLTIIATMPEYPIIVEADGRRLWRILENLYNNVAKYAMENTRVYISVTDSQSNVSFVMKNISSSPLNFQADELTERFIRGDVSRSTEGSGLGLSIAKSLAELMKGTFGIYLDGDLFRVTLTLPVKKEE